MHIACKFNNLERSWTLNCVRIQSAEPFFQNKNNSIDSLPDEIGKQILQMLDIRPRAKSHNTILDSTVSLDCNSNILREKYGSFQVAWE